MAEQIFDKFKYGNDTFIVQDNVSGYITTETDPVFTASPAHGITEQHISDWNSKPSLITVLETGKNAFVLNVNGSTATLIDYKTGTAANFLTVFLNYTNIQDCFFGQVINGASNLEQSQARMYELAELDKTAQSVRLVSVDDGVIYTADLQDTGSGLTGTFSSQTIGDIDTAGTGLSKSGTTLNHSNSVTAQTTQAVYPIKIDAQGHISAYGNAVTIPSDVNVTNTAVTATSTYYLTGGSSSATATGTLNKHASISAYVDADTSTTGLSRINLGNGTATGTAGAKQGVLRLYGNTAYYCDIRAEGSTPTANRTIYLPSYGGTMYLPCMSTSSAVGSANNPVYVEATGRIVAGNSFVPTTGGAFSGAVTAAASDGTTAQIANIKYGSAAPSGTATNGTVYFQTGSSAYTFQPRVNLPSLSASTTLSEWTHFTLPVGLYLITFQVNCGNINTYNLRVDLIAGSNTITQIRSGNGSNGNGLILNGVGLVECTSSTTIYFKAQTSSSSISNCELHYSYVKLF